MSQVWPIFCAIIFLFSSCKSRDDVQLASEDVGTEVFTLKGHRVFRFVCVGGEVAPNCKDWDFQELDELLESHVDYAAYKAVAGSLRDIETATKDIANVKAAMEKETRPFQKKGMQARIDVQERALVELKNIVNQNSRGEDLYLEFDRLRGDFLDTRRQSYFEIVVLLRKFRGQDWSRWMNSADAEQNNCALTPDGKPKCWGSNHMETTDGHQKKVKDRMLPLKMIRAGNDHSCALTSKGEPVCWGSDFEDRSDGHLGKVKKDMLPLRQISIGNDNTCALTHGGMPICWGSNRNKQSDGFYGTPPTSSLTTLTSGWSTSCALTEKGEPYCWGADPNGYKNVVKPEMLPLTAISTSAYNVCALTKRGEPICWGNDLLGKSSGYKSIVKTNMLPLRMISCGQKHTCALTKQGTPICWGGENKFQQLDGYQEILSPEMLPLKAISTGQFHTCALNSQGRVVCWGAIGNGGTTGRSPEGYKLGLNVPEDVDLSFEAFYYGDN